METQIIDMLYLELSQFSKAVTAKELSLQKEIDRLKMQRQNREFNSSESDFAIFKAGFEAAREKDSEIMADKYYHKYTTAEDAWQEKEK